MRKVSLAALVVANAVVACAESAPPPAHGPPAAAGDAPAEASARPSPPVHAPTGWKRFVSAAGGFSVYMPGTPTEKSRDENGGKGPILQAAYADESTATTYGVSYDDMDESFVGHPEELFDQVKDGFVHDPAAPRTLLAEAPASSLGVAGREMRFGEGDIVLAMRLYVDGEHVWTVMLSTPKDRFSDIEARAYLDTFRLTAAP